MVLVCLVVVSSCSFEKEEAEFGWLVDSKWVYDFEVVEGERVFVDLVELHDMKGALEIEIRASHGSVALEANSHFENFRKQVFPDLSVINVRDGLSLSKVVRCLTEMCLIAQHDFYLRIPLQPEIGQVLGSPYRPFSSYVVESLDEAVTVPLGTFNSFSQVDTIALRREVWSRDVGLIRYDIVDREGKTLGSFVLNSVEVIK